MRYGASVNRDSTSVVRRAVACLLEELEPRQLMSAAAGGDEPDLGDVASRAGSYVVVFGGRGSTVNGGFSQTVPAAPAEVEASQIAERRVDLTWSNPTSDAEGIRVERSKDGAAFAQVATLAGNATSYRDTLVTVGSSYVYRLVAYNAAGASMASQASVALSSAPIRLTVGMSEAGTVALAWPNNPDDTAGYIVERSTDGISYSLVATLAGAGVSSYEDTTAVGGRTYYYRVRTIATSSAVNARSGPASLLVPLPAPAQVLAQADSPTQVSLSWQDLSSNEGGFRIERSADGFASVQFSADLERNTTSYVDSGLSAGTTYWYRVSMYNGMGASDWSFITTVRTQGEAGGGDVEVDPPTAGIAAPAQVGVRQVATQRADVTWSSSVANVTGFLIERSCNGGTFAERARIAATERSFIDTTVNPGATYSWRVKAITGAGASPASAAVTLPISSAAIALTVQATMPGRVELAWPLNSADTAGYIVSRSTDGISYSDIATLTGAGVSGYSDTSVAGGRKYYYRVRTISSAILVAGRSGTVTAVTPLEAPTSLRARAVSATAVELMWIDNSSSESGFRIERSANGFASIDATFTTRAGQTRLIDGDLSPGMTYRYRVRAISGTAESSWSEKVQATTPDLQSPGDPIMTVPPTPTGLKAVASSQHQIEMRWTDVDGETYYAVQRSVDGGDFRSIATLPSGNVLFYDTSVSPGQSYQYRIVAGNDGGASAPSAAVAASTTQRFTLWNGADRKNGFAVARTRLEGGMELSYTLVEQTASGGTMRQLWAAQEVAGITVQVVFAQDQDTFEASIDVTNNSGYRITEMNFGMPKVLAPRDSDNIIYSPAKGGTVLPWSTTWTQGNTADWPGVAYSPVATFYNSRTEEGVGLTYFNSDLKLTSAFWSAGPQNAETQAIAPYVRVKPELGAGGTFHVDVSMQQGFKYPERHWQDYRDQVLAPFMAERGYGEASLKTTGLWGYTLWPGQTGNYRTGDLSRTIQKMQGTGMSEGYIQWTTTIDHPDYGRCFNPNVAAEPYWNDLLAASRLPGLKYLGVLINPFLDPLAPAGSEWDLPQDQYIAKLRDALAARGVTIAYWDTGGEPQPWTGDQWLGLLADWKRAGISIAPESSSDVAAWITGSVLHWHYAWNDYGLTKIVTPNATQFVLEDTPVASEPGQSRWWEHAEKAGLVPILRNDWLANL